MRTSAPSGRFNRRAVHTPFERTLSRSTPLPLFCDFLSARPRISVHSAKFDLFCRIAGRLDAQALRRSSDILHGDDPLAEQQGEVSTFLQNRAERR